MSNRKLIKEINNCILSPPFGGHSDHVRNLLIAAADALEAMEWRLIETAPTKNGDYYVYQPNTIIGRTSLPWRIVKVGDAGHVRKSTHWHPALTPPEVEK